LSDRVNIESGTRMLALACLGIFAAAAAARPVAAESARPPIIDVHLHAYAAADWTRRPPNPATGQPAPATAEAHMRETLAAMDKYNVVAAIVSGPLEAVEQWRQAAPQRILASPLFGRPGIDNSGNALPAIDALRELYRTRRLAAMAEVTAQYEGLSPSDPALDPYFAIAEELDIPVGIHTGTSFPGTPYRGSPRFRLALGNPLLLEDLLVRRPKLRVYIMHGGAPWTRETIALMQMYEHVYVDVAVIDWIGGPGSRPRFHDFLREMFAAGLGKRILFGTDQMRWPEAIGMAIDFVESAGFLSVEQKRDIFYNNAARFLKLDPPERPSER
jgi:predicted TIM-barrel fold metal-dependent hydrolase